MYTHSHLSPQHTTATNTPPDRSNMQPFTHRGTFRYNTLQQHTHHQTEVMCSLLHAEAHIATTPYRSTHTARHKYCAALYTQRHLSLQHTTGAHTPPDISTVQLCTHRDTFPSTHYGSTHTPDTSTVQPQQQLPHGIMCICCAGPPDCTDLGAWPGKALRSESSGSLL